MAAPCNAPHGNGVVSASASGLAKDAVVGQIEQFLQDALRRLTPDRHEARRGRGRPRVLPALALWGGLLVCVLRGFGSQAALWRLLSLGQLWFYPRFAVTDQAVYRRLGGAEAAPLQRLFERVSAVLAARLAPF